MKTFEYWNQVNKIWLGSVKHQYKLIFFNPFTKLKEQYITDYNGISMSSSYIYHKRHIMFITINNVHFEIDSDYLVELSIIK